MDIKMSHSPVRHLSPALALVVEGLRQVFRSGVERGSSKLDGVNGRKRFGTVDLKDEG